MRWLGPKSCLTIGILTAGYLKTSSCLSTSFHVYITRTIKARARIEKDATAAVFASSAFFLICFSSNLMKNVTKKCRMVQYLFINDL